MKRLLCLLLLAGCGNALPAASFIDKLRVLALQAEPPELAPGDTTQLSLLVVEPPLPQLDAGAPLPLSYLWLACALQPGAAQEAPCGLSSASPLGDDGGAPSIPPSCADAPSASPCLLGVDAGARYQAPRNLVPASGTAQVLITAVVADDAGGAFGCLADAFVNDGLPQNPDHCVLTLKRLTVSDPARTLQDGSAAPPPNHNPRLTDFSLADGDAQRSLVHEAPRFDLVSGDNPPSQPMFAWRADDASERYPSFDDQGVRSDLQEAILVSWFVTAGKMSSGRSAFDPPGCATQADCPSTLPTLTSSNRWTPPTAAELARYSADGSVTLWAVVRDDRGGVSWLQGSAAVR